MSGNMLNLILPTSNSLLTEKKHFIVQFFFVSFFIYSKKTGCIAERIKCVDVWKTSKKHVFIWTIKEVRISEAYFSEVYGTNYFCYIVSLWTLHNRNESAHNFIKATDVVTKTVI